jgi:subtilase family serine protease
LPAVGTATITLNTTVASLTPGGANVTLANSAVVNPNQAIDERTYTNNSATVQATDIAPPPPPQPQLLPDLTITSFTGGGTIARGGQVSYTATVANIGQATANQVQLVIAGGIEAYQILGAESGTPGLTPCLPPSPEGYGTLSIVCAMPASLTLAPGQSATVTVVAQVLATAQTGTFQMHASADPFNVVPESNENNNTTSGASTTIY